MSDIVAATAQKFDLDHAPQDRARADMDIGQAAALMGIPVPTLRKRLQRGTQAGFKSDDGTWRVVMNDTPAAETTGRPAVGMPIGDPSRPAWEPAAQPSQVLGQPEPPSAAVEMLAMEIRELREEIERNSALLEATQWQIAQINPPGQFQNLQSHTEAVMENQLRPVVSSLMAVLDYLGRGERKAPPKTPLSARRK